MRTNDNILKMKKMKLFNLLSILSIGIVALFLASCQNSDQSFPDYEGGSAVYFAYQYPVRTIVLGEDVYDTTLDNEHRFEIYAVMSGVYANNNKVTIDVSVDNTLVDNLFFEAGGSPVVAMPSNYYTLAGNQIVLDKKIQGAVGVQLSDAFFADPKALERTYVLPLVMNKVQNADSILSGRRAVTGDPELDNASRTNPDGWDVQPKDFVLYAVKFINPWHANYLRRGVDQITAGGSTTTEVRHAATVEKDQVILLASTSLTGVKFPVTTTDAGGTTITCDVLLTFDSSGNCQVSTQTPGMSASGSGKFVEKGEKLSWGNKDRDAIYLDYTVDFGAKQYATRDTLVIQGRGIKAEWFEPSYVN